MKTSLMLYAAKHDDFGEAMWDAAIDLLLETVITDELVSPDPATLVPTPAEKAKVENAKLLTSLLHGGLADMFKNF